MQRIPRTLLARNLQSSMDIYRLDAGMCKTVHSSSDSSTIV